MLRDPPPSPISAASAPTSADADDVVRIAYEELHRIAHRYLRARPGGATLQATELLHEAYLRLVGRGVRWESRDHFVAITAQIMRRVLLDHARRKRAAKRGGGWRITTGGKDAASGDALDLVALDEALTRLAALDPRAARVVELRYFAGLEVEETARVLGLSAATVKRDWRFARAWLANELSMGDGGP
jgi:RNA polymerase sigma-70 factor, ECF subfamily